MPKRLDLTGERYGYLVALEWIDYVPSSSRWRCICDCGNTTIVRANSLRIGRTQSCGCLHKELLSERSTIHGMSQTLIYKTWLNLKTRCLNSNSPNFVNYGGRGITICQRWQDSFEYFFADMDSRPSPNHTIERINNDGPYSPDNCTWALPYQQARNMRTNRRITFEGETKCLADWAKEYNLLYTTLLYRIKAGWPIEKALTKRP